MQANPPRLLVIMGSGETSPTMTAVHADLLARAGAGPDGAVLLDSPFGFQENADEVAGKAISYFRGSVGHDIAVASFRRADSAEPLEYETMLARLRQARYVFSGPGSPSYALRQWRGSAVPEVLSEKLRDGGCVVFASAAACTLGRFTLPVYEVYKVGDDPHWLDGLDLMGELGITGAVIPHYDNAEGGTHDTRYCYMGERRLRLLEAELPDGAGILGVDEHTACVFDLDAGSVTVRGRGGVTLRRRGRSRRFESGSCFDLDALRQTGMFETEKAATGTAAAGVDEAAPAARRPAGDPFWEGVEERRRQFEQALAVGHVDEALAAILALDTHRAEWASDTLDSDAMDRARSLLRTMIVRLGDLAQLGARDPRELVAPFVDAVLELRRRARDGRRWDDADALRDTLLRLGIEIQDHRDSPSTWTLPAGFGESRSQPQRV
jgi:cyanophycinase-like exopeptidase